MNMEIEKRPLEGEPLNEFMDEDFVTLQRDRLASALRLSRARLTALESDFQKVKSDFDTERAKSSRFGLIVKKIMASCDAPNALSDANVEEESNNLSTDLTEAVLVSMEQNLPMYEAKLNELTRGALSDTMEKVESAHWASVLSQKEEECLSLRKEIESLKVDVQARALAVGVSRKQVVAKITDEEEGSGTTKETLIKEKNLLPLHSEINYLQKENAELVRRIDKYSIVSDKLMSAMEILESAPARALVKALETALRQRDQALEQVQKSKSKKFEPQMRPVANAVKAMDREAIFAAELLSAHKKNCDLRQALSLVNLRLEQYTKEDNSLENRISAMENAFVAGVSSEDLGRSLKEAFEREKELLVSLKKVQKENADLSSRLAVSERYKMGFNANIESEALKHIKLVESNLAKNANHPQATQHLAVINKFVSLCKENAKEENTQTLYLEELEKAKAQESAFAKAAMALQEQVHFYKQKCDALSQQSEAARDKALQSIVDQTVEKLTGIDVNANIDDLKEKLVSLRLCSICRCNVKNSIITKCNHVFCDTCVDENIKSRTRACPTCNTKFSAADVRPFSGYQV